MMPCRQQLNTTVRTVYDKAGDTIAIATIAGEPWRVTIGRGVDGAAAGSAALDAMDAAEGLVSPTLLKARTPAPGESYADYLLWYDLLGYGFAYQELVDGDRRRMEPPRRLWQNMIPTLALACLLRQRMVDRGAVGLRVNAAHRPKSGGRRHRWNTALDLDLLSKDRRLGGAYLEELAKLYGEHRAALRMGAGSYHPEGTRWTNRAHIDAGTDEPRPNSWQISGGEYVTPGALAEIVGGR